MLLQTRPEDMTLWVWWDVTLWVWWDGTAKFGYDAVGLVREAMGDAGGGFQ